MDVQALWRYKWHDTPNNQDGLMKAFALGKQASKFGIILGVADVIATDVQRNNLQKALRVGAWVVPLVGMSTAFTITQQVSTKIFNVNDKFAFMFGGMSAAGVLGSWFRNGQMAFSASVILGAVGFAYQYVWESRMEGIRMEGKQSRWAEQFTFYPEDAQHILYERHQTSHWLFNTYDWRLRQKKERGAEVANI